MDKIISHPSTPEYEEGWDRIFGKMPETSLPGNDHVMCRDISIDECDTYKSCGDCPVMRETDAQK